MEPCVTIGAVCVIRAHAVGRSLSCTRHTRHGSGGTADLSSLDAEEAHFI